MRVAQKRLKPDGIMAQWIPLHSQGKHEVFMHFKTFLSSISPCHGLDAGCQRNYYYRIKSAQLNIDLEKLKGTVFPIRL